MHSRARIQIPLAPIIAALVVVAALGTSAHAQVTTGLINHWALNETSGTSGSDLVGGNNLGLFNYGMSETSWTPGVYDNGLAFAGNNYAITASAIAPGNQFSVSFWMRASYVNDGTNDVIATPQTQNWIYARPGSGVGIESLFDNRPTLYGVWEHGTVTHDGSTGQTNIYRDGALRVTGSLSLPTLNQRWVLGHNQDPGNSGSSLTGALDDVKLFNRVLTPSEVVQLAARPPARADIVATLAVPAQSFGPVSTGQYYQAQATVFLDPANTNWVAWNRFPELRGMSDLRPNELFLGTQTPEVDDFIRPTVTNPNGQSLTFDLDQNGVVGAPIGQQAVIFGLASATPDVLRGDNSRSNSIFNEGGIFDSIFTVPGDYLFNFSFRSIGSDGGFPDIYIVRQIDIETAEVPEPAAVTSFALVALLGGSCCWPARRKLRPRAV